MTGYDNELATSFALVADDRRLTVFPRLIERIGAHNREARLLDYGGGHGEFARLCASSLPLKRVATYDPSPAMRALALAENAGNIEVLASTSELANRSFDVVTCNGVWMCWTSNDECESNLIEIARLLDDGGLLLASVTHPCFRDERFATYRTTFDPKDYLNDGTRFHVTVSDGSQEAELEDTHWSLGAMTRQLRAAHLQLLEIVEVADRSGAPGSPWMIVAAQLGG